MTTKPAIYFLSGLAADEQVFSRLKLNFEYSFISWIANEKKESLGSYASRLASEIKEDKVILVGLSFGGMVAQEIAAQRPVEQLILINSVASKLELPSYFRLAGLIHLAELLPAFMYSRSNLLLNWMFSMSSSNEKTLLDGYIKQSSPSHLAWALQHISCWHAPQHSSKIIRLHGLQDRIFPTRLIKHYIPLQGGHFSVYSRALEASKILNQLIAQTHDQTS